MADENTQPNIEAEDTLTGDDSGEKKGKKRKKSKKEKRSRDGRKRGIRRFVPLFVILALVIALIALVFLDVFGLRTNAIDPLLRSIPIVSNLLPPLVEENGENLEEATPERLRTIIDEMQREIDELTTHNEHLEALRAINIARIEILEEFEQQQLAFQAERAAFDRMIAESDPAAFAAFFESISPENMEILGPEAQLSAQRARDFRQFMAMVQSMDESDAADILEELVRTDMDLVVLVMTNVAPEFRGGILSAMSTQTATMVFSAIAVRD